MDKGVTGGSIVLPNSTAMGNVEVNNRVSSAYNAIVAALKAAGKLDAFKVDAGPEGVGVDADPNDPVNAIVSLFELRGDVVGAFAGNNVFTPALAKAVAQTGMTGKICAYGFDLGPAQQEAIASRRPDRLARSAAVPAGLLAGHAALPADRPRHRRRQPRHARPARDEGHRSATSASASRTSPRPPVLNWSREGYALSRLCV